MLEGNSEESDGENQKENQAEGKKLLGELKLFSFKKKMQFENKKKKNEVLQEPPSGQEPQSRDVHERLFGKNNKNNGAEHNGAIEIDNVQIQSEQNQKLYLDLKKCKSKKEQLRVVREHWKTMKKGLEDNLFSIRNLDFSAKYKKNNFNLNLFFANFLPQQNQLYNQQKKQYKQMNHNDGEELEKVEKIVQQLTTGGLHEIWKDYQYDNLLFN